MKRRWLRISLFVILALVIVYLLGPKPEAPVYNTGLPAVPESATALEQYIQTK